MSNLAQREQQIKGGLGVGSGNHTSHHTKHGLSGTKLYKVWTQMKQRCYNINDSSYKYYGAKGISVCAPWKTFETFYQWSVKNSYKEGLEIDRVDVHGNYEPNNCQWITPYENRSKDSLKITGEVLSQCKKLYYSGMSLRKIGRQLGCSHSNISKALKKEGFLIKIKNFTEEELSEMIEAHLVGGVSMRQIEKHSTINRHTLSKYIKEAS